MNGFDYELLSFIFVVGVIAILVGVILLMKYRYSFFTRNGKSNEAIEIVKLRYARGEIDLQEYEKLMNELVK
ncbi:SHOCT domain-containing protein [Tepidibacillus fermentans]|nr:SHOCT domain-containing protein [Tepidibacillus fermentans]